MADASSYPKLQVPSNHVANAGKFYYNFLYKAVIVTIFLVILPLFSSQAPEFINQNLHNTSWELVHLIFVGIAVSYGLFSKRSSEETDHKEHSSKFDNAQSYVSRLLQVSSVFDDDEAEAEAKAENTCDVDDNKIQTWNSQYYYRGEPVVVVAKEYGHIATTTTTTTTSSSRINIGDKPLLLPVRSLKSPDMLETTQESTSKAASLISSNENKFRIGEFQGEIPLNLEEREEINLVHPSGSKRFSGNTHKSRNELLVEESVVHRSPIPWRSRSARMEMKEDVDGRPLYPTSPASVENSESIRLQSRSLRSLSSRADSKNSPNYSPNKLSLSSLSPSPSWSSVDSQLAKSVEDVVRKKNFHRSSTPPPPPPPPPFLRKSNSSLTNDEVPVTPVKELRRSIRSVPMEFRHKERVEPPRRAHSGSYMAAKSVGALRPNEALKTEVKAKEFRHVDEAFVERREEEFPTMTERSVLEFPEEEKQEYMEKVVAETHDEDTDQTESEDDYFEEVGGKEEVSPSKEEAVSDGGPDVDKKADEFIAKFREQIRLQRLESIRRSTRQQHHHLLRNLSR